MLLFCIPAAACELRWKACVNEISVMLNSMQGSLSDFSDLKKKIPNSKKHLILRAISGGGKGVHKSVRFKYF